MIKIPFYKKSQVASNHDYPSLIFFGDVSSSSLIINQKISELTLSFSPQINCIKISTLKCRQTYTQMIILGKKRQRNNKGEKIGDVSPVCFFELDTVLNF